MDNLDAIIDKTVINLKKNNFTVRVVENKEMALAYCKSLIKSGEKVVRGGSSTIIEIGLKEYIENGEFVFKDIYAAKTPEEVQDAIISRLTCDTFFASCNAVTTSGYLYNVDGRCTRVAPILSGPKKVVLVVGVNKIVETLEDAIHRVKTIVAPKNAIRLKLDTPCTKTGVCQDCNSPQRICCGEVTLKKNRFKDRIEIVIVKENLGY